MHTTGQDVQQPFAGVAVVTLSKDMTLRDYKQGVWRMRLIGRGQSVCVVVVDEVLRFLQGVATKCGYVLAAPPVAHQASPSTPTALSSPGSVRTLPLTVGVVAWLTLNGIRNEQLQALQLLRQNVATLWRRAALRALMASTVPQQEQVHEIRAAIAAARGTDASAGAASTREAGSETGEAAAGAASEEDDGDDEDDVSPDSDSSDDDAGVCESKGSEVAPIHPYCGATRFEAVPPVDAQGVLSVAEVRYSCPRLRTASSPHIDGVCRPSGCRGSGICRWRLRTRATHTPTVSTCTPACLR